MITNSRCREEEEEEEEEEAWTISRYFLCLAVPSSALPEGFGSGSSGVCLFRDFLALLLLLHYSAVIWRIFWAGFSCFWFPELRIVSASKSI
jgi:hypothetical protein